MLTHSNQHKTLRTAHSMIKTQHHRRWLKSPPFRRENETQLCTLFFFLIIIILPLGSWQWCSHGLHTILSERPSHPHPSEHRHKNSNKSTGQFVTVLLTCANLSPSWWGQIWGDRSWGPARGRKRTWLFHCSIPQPAPPVHHLQMQL